MVAMVVVEALVEQLAVCMVLLEAHMVVAVVVASGINTEVAQPSVVQAVLAQ
jgi:hypothetical protein